MKTTRRLSALVFSLLLVFSSTAALAAAPFSRQDLRVNTVTVDRTPEQVRQTCGDPVTVEKNFVAATGETEEIWNYPEFTLTFSSTGKIIGAYWTQADVLGPRDLKVGDKEQAVINAFYVDPASTAGTVLYTAGNVDALNMQLPPCGVTMHNEDGTFQIWYLDPVEPYGEDVLNDPAGFVYQDHASLLFSFDGSATVTAVSWTIGALAE